MPVRNVSFKKVTPLRILTRLTSAGAFNFDDMKDITKPVFCAIRFRFYTVLDCLIGPNK